MSFFFVLCALVWLFFITAASVYGRLMKDGYARPVTLSLIWTHEKEIQLTLKTGYWFLLLIVGLFFFQIMALCTLQWFMH